MADDDLMTIYRRNPREGFRRLYRELAPRLKGYLLRSFTITSEQAEDLIHDAFLPWVETPERMREVANPVSYLFTSVRNGFLNSQRRQPSVPVEENLPGGVDPADQIGDLAVSAALDTLPAEQREAVAMRVWGGLSLAEAADQQGVPLQTLASRCRTGLGKLKELLGWTT